MAEGACSQPWTGCGGAILPVQTSGLCCKAGFRFHGLTWGQSLLVSSGPQPLAVTILLVRFPGKPEWLNHLFQEVYFPPNEHVFQGTQKLMLEPVDCLRGK